MALDGIFLHCLQREIADGAVGDRVDKIHQPTKEEIVLTLRGAQRRQKVAAQLSPGQCPCAFYRLCAGESGETPYVYHAAA